MRNIVLWAAAAALLSVHCAHGVDLDIPASGGATGQASGVGTKFFAGDEERRTVESGGATLSAGGAGGKEPALGTGFGGSLGLGEPDAAVGVIDKPATADAGDARGAMGESRPYLGTATRVPGIVEAEAFDDGGEGVAYADTNVQNYGSQYRETGVDIEKCTDTGGGYDVGWNYPGEWRNYTVDVTTTGKYAIAVRTASANMGGAFHLEVDGNDCTGRLVAPNTGGWQTWTSVSKSGIALTAGRHVLRMVIDESNEFNINRMDLTVQ